ncbi:rRNA-processing protein [Hirschfeldia incana]|nr:rRNA-processing protein [Hirschfeldia incana]
MKNFNQRDEHETDDARKGYKKSTRSKNMKRLGGGGLSLQTFANLKSKNSHYNPALIKKQKEYYKNAKYVSKFRKSMKQQKVQEKDEMKLKQSLHGEDETTGESSSSSSKVVVADDDEHKGKKSHKRIGVEEVYKQTREEMEKARKEREEAFQAKKQAKEEAESRRKAAKGKMMRKTRHGQPVMKYRIEHLLESIKKTAENDGKNCMTSSS